MSLWSEYKDKEKPLLLRQSGQDAGDSRNTCIGDKIFFMIFRYMSENRKMLFGGWDFVFENIIILKEVE